MKPETSESLSPPNNRPPNAVTQDYPDDIRDLGDQIIALNRVQAKELSEYLEQIL